MKTLSPVAARFLMILMWLSVPLGCASTTGGRSAQSPEAIPAPSQITLQPLDAQTSGHDRLHPIGKENELEDAVNALLEKLDRGAIPGEIFHRVAVLYAKNGDFERAEDYYRDAMRHGRSNAEILTDYGHHLALQGRYDEAEFTLRKAIQLDPDAARARNNLGLVLVATGRRDEAMEAFTQAGANEVLADANLRFAALWSEQTSRHRFTSIDQPPRFNETPSSRLDRAQHQLANFTGPPDYATIPSE